MITILTDVEDLPMTDPHDVRSFISGEIEELSPANEKLLIDLGLAAPTAADVSTEFDIPSLEARLALLKPEQLEHLASIAGADEQAPS